MLSSLGGNMVGVSNTECALSAANSGRSESRIGKTYFFDRAIFQVGPLYRWEDGSGKLPEVS